MQKLELMHTHCICVIVLSLIDTALKDNSFTFEKCARYYLTTIEKDSLDVPSFG